MRLWHHLMIVAVASTGASFLAGRDSAAEPPLVVHEWGTFTSFSGSDGVNLEFRPLKGKSDLPSFVFNRARISSLWLTKDSLPAIQRMETPVTYFYTPVERDVKVRVEFPQGLLTEFYPPVHKMQPDTPAFADERKLPLKDSLLDWGTVHLIPAEQLRAHVNDPELARRIGRHVEATMVPHDNTGHYAAARETDSAIVQVRHLPGSKIRTGDYFEKFLFYRGLGNFELPLTVKAIGSDLQVINRGDHEVRSLFLVTVRGEKLWFHEIENILPQATLALPKLTRESKTDDLAGALTAALIGEGLYPKEAAAMVKTWRDSWLGEEGTRLFYMLPTQITDRVLPLHIDPKPSEVVRVLVGRMEIMTASEEQRVLDLVSRSAASRKDIGDVKTASPLLKEVKRLGRLAEPALVRVRAISGDAAIRTEAERLIEEIYGNSGGD